MRYFALLLVLFAAVSCTHSRNNPCDEEGAVFDPNVYGQEAREEFFEMGWVRNIAGENCGALIDRFEASRRSAASDGTSAGTDDGKNPRSLPGYLPWTEITFEDAKKACNGAEGDYKRICKKSEYMIACKGGYVNEPEPTETDNLEKNYPYGTEYLPKICNGKDKGMDRVATSGENTECFTDQSVIFVAGTKTPGLFDLVGNVAEWVEDDDTGDGLAIGGSYLSAEDGLACDSVDTDKDPGTKYKDVGFRCCK